MEEERAVRSTRYDGAWEDEGGAGGAARGRGALGFREGELEGFVEWHKVRK